MIENLLVQYFKPLSEYRSGLALQSTIPIALWSYREDELMTNGTLSSLLGAYKKSIKVFDNTSLTTSQCQTVLLAGIYYTRLSLNINAKKTPTAVGWKGLPDDLKLHLLKMAESSDTKSSHRYKAYATSLIITLLLQDDNSDNSMLALDFLRKKYVKIKPRNIGFPTDKQTLQFNASVTLNHTNLIYLPYIELACAKITGCGTIADLDLSAQHLPHACLDGAVFNNVNFSASCLRYSYVKKMPATFLHVRFMYTVLDNACLPYTTFTFNQSTADGLNYSSARHTDFRHTSWTFSLNNHSTGLDWRDVKLSHATFINIHLQSSQLDNARLEKVIFSGDCQFAKVSLGSTKLISDSLSIYPYIYPILNTDVLARVCEQFKQTARNANSKSMPGGDAINWSEHTLITDGVKRAPLNLTSNLARLIQLYMQDASAAAMYYKTPFEKASFNRAKQQGASALAVFFKKEANLGHIARWANQKIHADSVKAGQLGQFKISKIELINNQTQWQCYQQEKQAIIKELLKSTRQFPINWHSDNPANFAELDRTAGECLLFHGTSAAAVTGISESKDGFRIGNGDLGQGIYFTDAWQKADVYAKESIVGCAACGGDGISCCNNKPTPKRMILLCQVLLGEPLVLLDHQSLNNQPFPINIGKHSVYAPAKCFKRKSAYDRNEFLVPSSARAYPLAAITYYELTPRLDSKLPLTKNVTPSPNMHSAPSYDASLMTALQAMATYQWTQTLEAPDLQRMAFTRLLKATKFCFKNVEPNDAEKALIDYVQQASKLYVTQIKDIDLQHCQRLWVTMQRTITHSLNQSVTKQTWREAWEAGERLYIVLAKRTDVFLPKITTRIYINIALAKLGHEELSQSLIKNVTGILLKAWQCDANVVSQQLQQYQSKVPDIVRQLSMILWLNTSTHLDTNKAILLSCTAQNNSKKAMRALNVLCCKMAGVPQDMLTINPAAEGQELPVISAKDNLCLMLQRAATWHQTLLENTRYDYITEQQRILLSQFSRYQLETSEAKSNVKMLFIQLMAIPMDIANFYNLSAENISTALASLYDAGILAKQHQAQWKVTLKQMALSAQGQLSTPEKIDSFCQVAKQLIQCYTKYWPLLPDASAFQLAMLQSAVLNDTANTNKPSWQQIHIPIKPIALLASFNQKCPDCITNNELALIRLLQESASMQRMSIAKVAIQHINWAEGQAISSSVYDLVTYFYSQKQGSRANYLLIAYLSAIKQALTQSNLQRKSSLMLMLPNKKNVTLTVPINTNNKNTPLVLCEQVTEWLQGNIDVLYKLSLKMDNFSLKQHQAAAAQIHSATGDVKVMWFEQLFTYLIYGDGLTQEILIDINYQLPEQGLQLVLAGNHYQLYQQTFSPHREAFMHWLQSQGAKNTAEHIACLPYKNGYRLSTAKKRQAWQATLNNLVSNKGRYKLTLLTENGLQSGFWPASLNNQIRKALADDGRSQVWSLILDERTIYIKEYPRFPSMERASYLLASRLTGEGVPPCCLGRLQFRGEDIPILISEGVPGETLHAYLENKANVLAPPNAKRFSQVTLLAMALMLEDNKPDNVIGEQVSGELILNLIDNEHILLPEFVQRAGDNLLNVKSILWCMDAMKQAINKEVLQDFCSLEIEKVLFAWLGELANEDKFIASNQNGLFTLSEVTAFAARVQRKIISREPEPILLRPYFQQDGVYELYKRLKKMQRFCQSALTQKQAITHFNLLKHILPQVAALYQQTCEQHVSPWARFYPLVKEAYQLNNNRKMITKTKTIDVMNTQRVNLSELIHNTSTHQFSPSAEIGRLKQWIEEDRLQERQTLLTALTKDSTETFLAAFAQASLPLQEYFIAHDVQDLIKGDSDKTLNHQFQQRVIQAIIHVNGLRKIMLSGFQQLNDEVLDAILRKHAQSLKKFSINGCSQISTFGQNKLLQRKINLPLLKRIDVRECRGLTKSFLDACVYPELQMISGVELIWPWVKQLTGKRLQFFTEENTSASQWYLGQSLKTNNTLTEVDINNYKNHKMDLQYVSDALKINTQLTKLTIHGRGKITSTNIQKLSETIKFNTTLTELSLSNVDFIGMKFLTDVLKTNVSLLHLYVTCNLSLACVRRIDAALKVNTNLVTLGLYNINRTPVSEDIAQYFYDAILVNNTTLVVLNLGYKPYSIQEKGVNRLLYPRYILKYASAIKVGDLKMVKALSCFLVNFGIRGNKKRSELKFDDDGNTALHIAVKYEQWEMLSFLIFHCYYSRLTKTKNNKGEFYLQNKQESLLTQYVPAIKRGDLRMVQTITNLSFFLGINDKNNYSIDDAGNTALHIAVENQQLEIVEFLLNNKYNHLSKLQGIKNKDGNKPHVAAIKSGNLELLKILSKNWTIDYTWKLDDNGNTALHIAAENQQWDIVQYLSQHFPDLKLQKNNDGELPQLQPQTDKQEKTDIVLQPLLSASQQQSLKSDVASSKPSTAPKKNSTKINQFSLFKSPDSQIGVLKHDDNCYKRITIPADDDCGYSALNLTRQQAFQLLTDNAGNTEVQNLVSIAIKETLITTKAFQACLLLEDLVEVEDIVALKSNPTSFTVNVGIVKAYVNFDVNPGNTSAECAPPSVLQALAYIKKFRLNLWSLDSGGNLQPHIVCNENYSNYEPDSATETMNLLFVNGNHFDRLESLENKNIQLQL